MAGFRWLHLSDFHVGEVDFGAGKLFQYICAHVKSQKIPPDFVFITGDIAHSGLVAEYEVFLKHCFEPLQALTGSQCRFFIVPGNHDVDRSKQEFVTREAIWVKKETFFEPSAKGLASRNSVLPRFKAYKKQSV